MYSTIIAFGELMTKRVSDYLRVKGQGQMYLKLVLWLVR